MNRFTVRLLIGLVLAVALAWGATLDVNAAAKAAAKATAKVTAKATATTSAATTARATAKTAARTAKAKAPVHATADAVLPSTTLAGTTLAEAAAAAQPGKAKGKLTRDQVYVEKFKRIAPSLQAAAARNARLKGLKPGVAGKAALGIAAAAPPLPGTEGPGGIPHYFGPYGNWAFSPLPRGPIAKVNILAGGTGYTSPIIVVDDAYGTGASISIPTTQIAGVVQAPVIPLAGVGADFSAPVATVIDDPALCGGAAPQVACGTGALADALVGGTVTGGLHKFVDTLPGLGPAGANNLGQYIPVAVADTISYPGSDYYEIALVEYAEQMHSDLPGPFNVNTPGALGTKLRGYVQLATANVPGTVTVPLAGGASVTAVDKPHYLGPLIVAQGRVMGIEATNPAKGAARPVRIKFVNLLPLGSGGDLFLPVDPTVPGAGPGPAGGNYPQNRATIHLHGNNTVWISDGNTHQWISPANEATYPAGVSARNVPDMAQAGCASDPLHPELPGQSGCQTFFYTNAQSARLQFYHDHAMGITRLNVYAGEAAGYVVTDAVEADMINGTNDTGVNPTFKKVLPDIGVPLVIQDKTWVDADTVFAQDPTWNWGTTPKTAGKITAANTGDLWYPHVYMTVTNPFDVTGTNAVGRWFYGPWFSPPTPVCVGGAPVGCIEVGTVPNEYYDPINAPWEPPQRPGVPNPSIPGESFLDTPIVNGTAYPYLEVEPRAYRFRVLNAANDRMLNLQLYVAADKTGPTTAGSNYALTPAKMCDPLVAPAVGIPSVGPAGDCTEVKMVPVAVAPANQYADTPSGIPDPATAGPPWIQIGTEGGFMPAPVTVPHLPIGYNLDPAYFNFGIVNQHSLFLGPAERADVLVDFTGLAGKTFIIYNDSPAPVPAGAAPYDFYTGDGNLMDSGGAPNTLPGYGPNTRTIMQIRVSKPVDPTKVADLTQLPAVFAKTPTKRGVFEVSQDPIIIPQTVYNTAYDKTFPTDASQFILNLGDVSKTFQPLGYDSVTNSWNLQPAVTIPLEMKAMHDEMGGVYETAFGRMSGMLGLTNPASPVHVLIPYGLSSPPTDIVKGSLEATPVGVLADGTQLWRIFHNGVDTHPIHTHLFTAQLISRVGQDGQVAPGAFPAGQAVDASDMGWKDTFKVNPLEMTFLALRPTVPAQSTIPFEVPDSIRLIDPTLPAGAILPPPAPAGWFDTAGNALAQLVNHTVNFGWEYVWHCHILSHEEMDFMHSLAFAVPPIAPTGLTGANTGTANNPKITLIWTDNSTKEAQTRIERAANSTFTSGLTTVATLAGTTTIGQRSFTDSKVPKTGSFWYRVWAVGATVGDVATAGFPTMSGDSVSNTIAVQLGATATTPLAPTGLAATWLAAVAPALPQVTLTWTDNATNETGFAVERCTVVAPATTCTTFAQIAAPAAVLGTGTATYIDTTVAANGIYSYRVKAVNGLLSSAYSNVVTTFDPAVPAAPTGVTVVNSAAGTVTVTWTASTSGNVVSYTIQQAANANFTRRVSSSTVAAPATTTTLTVSPGTYYYRIRANSGGASSGWTNASPFPIPVL